MVHLPSTLHQTETRAKIRLKEVGELKSAAQRGRAAAAGRDDRRATASLKGLYGLVAVFVAVIAAGLGGFMWLMHAEEEQRLRDRYTY